jgi:hypothetical protein
LHPKQEPGKSSLWQVGRRERFDGALVFSLPFKLIRNAKLQADRSAVQYEIAPGYDPMEFCQLLWNQFQRGEEPASLLGRLLESRSSTATRLQGIQRSIAAILVCPNMQWIRVSSTT